MNDKKTFTRYSQRFFIFNLKLKNLFLILLFGVQTTFAQIISKDASFASNGIFTLSGNLTWSTVQTPDGQMYFTHNMNNYPGLNVTESYLSKLTANGTLDQTFGNNGKVQLPYNSCLNRMKRQTDGKLVILGFTDTGATVSRIFPNGQFDITFGTGGTTIMPLGTGQNYTSYGLILQNEKIIVHGIDTNSQVNHIIYRLNTDGSIDNTFGNNGSVLTGATHMNRVFVLTDSQANIFNLKAEGGIIQKFDQDGHLVTNFGNNGSIQLNTEANIAIMDSSNKIVLSQGTEDKLIRVNPDRTIDYTFNYNSNTNSGLNGGSWVQSIVEKEGSYYIGGTDNTNNLISKLTPNGSVDPVFNTYLQTDSDVEEMFISNTNIIVRGNGYMVKYLLTNGTLSTRDITEMNHHISFENPVKNNLIYQSKEKIKKIEIYSLNGKIVKTIKDSNTLVSELLKGIYVAKITFENGNSVTKKLIKN